MELAPDLETARLLERIQSDFNTLAGPGLSFHSPDDLTAVVVAIPAVRAQIGSLAASTAAEMDRWGIAKDAGYRTVEQLVGDRTGADPQQTRADVRLGRWIDDFDLFAEALAAGTITTAHVEHIRRTLHNPRTSERLTEDQAEFVEWAADYDFIDFEYICDYWKNSNGPSGSEPKDQIARTNLKPRKRADGCVKIDGLLDPLMGQAFMSMWEHEDQKLFRADQGRNRRNTQCIQRTRPPRCRTTRRPLRPSAHDPRVRTPRRHLPRPTHKHCR